MGAQAVGKLAGGLEARERVRSAAWRMAAARRSFPAAGRGAPAPLSGYTRQDAATRGVNKTTPIASHHEESLIAEEGYDA